MKILTLTLNPAIDVHCSIAEFNACHENKAIITSRQCSGKGVNVSRALNACGTDNLALIVLGSENGDEFRRETEKDGINGIYLTVPGRIRENITVHPAAGRETRLSFTGMDSTPDLIGRIDEIVSRELSAGDYLTFTGSCLEKTDMAQIKDFLRKYINAGVHVVIDSKSVTPKDIDELKPWLIKPNEEEIVAFLGHAVSGIGEAMQAAGEIRSRGIENVMISLGPLGGVLACSEGVFHCFIAEDRPRLSTIGAGDSSVAGFVSGASRGYSAKDCLKLAMCCGTAAIMTEGTMPPLKEDIERLFGNN